MKSNKLNIVHIEFTSHCNLRCVFCYASQPEYQGVHMNEAVLESVIHSLTSLKPKIVNVNGHGETTIYKNWHRYCNQLLDEGFTLQIISNFVKKFNDEELETLARFSGIEISCDTIDPVLFQELRRGADLQTLVENIKRVQAIASKRKYQGPRLSFSCVVSDKTVSGLKDLVSFGISLGIQHFNFCNLVKYPRLEMAIPVNHVTEIPFAEMVKAKQSIHDAFDLLRSARIEFHFQQGLMDSLEEKIQSAKNEKAKTDSQIVDSVPAPDPSAAEMNHRHPLRYAASAHQQETRDCLDPWSFALVQADGDVLPCCWHHPVGSLNQHQNLEDVLNGHMMQELRISLLTGSLHPDCQSCPSKGLISIDDLKKQVSRKIGKAAVQAIKKFSDSFRELAIEYGDGWYGEESDPNQVHTDWKKWRWTSRKAVFTFSNPRQSSSLIIRGLANKTILPGQKIAVRINGITLDEFIPLHAKFFKEYRLAPETTGAAGLVSGEIEVDQAFVPSQFDTNSQDQRALGVQIFRLSLDAFRK